MHQRFLFATAATSWIVGIFSLGLQCGLGQLQNKKNSENISFHTLIPDSAKIERKIPPPVELTESISAVFKSEKGVLPLTKFQKILEPTQIPIEDS